MSDEQLRQAAEIFTEGPRAQAVRRRLARRAAEVPLDVAADNVGHRITDADQLGSGGLGAKYRDNIAAIRVLKALRAEGRAPSEGERRQLARYVGWGGLKGVFDEQNTAWARQHHELKALLGDGEYAAARRSQLDAFYTPANVVNAIYRALERVGFDGGRVIDPAVGIGNFIGLMPPAMRAASQIHGVELDQVSSEIAARLYPGAQIAQSTAFQNFSGAVGGFDLVVGNPPFGGHVVADPGKAYSGWSIHNYFFAKSIELLRPGGMMAMVVSNAFLDKLDPQVRAWIGRRADLVAGARLPDTAFKQGANTEVVTDVLVFQRLDHENMLGPREEPLWLNSTDVEVEGPDGSTVHAINDYFLANPQNVLGRHRASGGMYRGGRYTVEATGDLGQQLDSWAATLPEKIFRQVVRQELTPVRSSQPEIPDGIKEGSHFLVAGKVWLRLPDLNGLERAVEWPAPNQKAAERMAGMIVVRDALRAQMTLERSSAGDTEIAEGRAALNNAYDAFRKTHGLLNDAVNRRLFNDDTESPLLQALEFDYEKAITPAYAAEHGLEPRASSAVKADIFSTRVLFPPGEVEVVETAKDALLHSLNLSGRVDLDYMERAYGRTREQIVQELGNLIFADPDLGYVTSDEYLSGDVKTKLQRARDHGALSNVAALEAVIPVDKLPSEIHASLGAMWIPVSAYAAFAKEISGGTAKFTYVRATGQWMSSDRRGVDFAKNNNEFGTPKVGALDLLIGAMNSKAVEVKKAVQVDGHERYVTDEQATEAARQAADKVKSHWESWLWSDPERAGELAAIYNEGFNRRVNRQYDGSHLTLPGLNPAITLLAHQKNAVWRGLQDRVMLLDHVVGAGKTFEKVALLMEMRRLGICKKPMLVVPNHLTLQWRSEFYRLYPGANILAATPDDFDKENRERLFSKIVTGNWDAVIIGHSSLKKIPLPVEAEMAVMNEQVADISSAIEELKRDRGDRHVVRDMEKIKTNLEAKVTKLKEKAGTRSKVVDMADLGIDAIGVDEAHEFKNLFFNTQMNRVAGLGNPAGSGKAFDLFVKVRWLQSTFGEKAPLIFATGTPISNSLGEMFTMQRYMQYGQMKRAGLNVFDAWAKLYGDVQNVYEVAPSGTGYRLSQRFAKFKNLGSLMADYRSFADVVTLSDLKEQEIARGKTFPVPQLEGGKPHNIVVPRSRLQEEFFGIPMLSRAADGGIRFELDLGLPTSIVQAADGKFEMHQQDGPNLRVGSRRFDTEAEARYMTAVAALTPVLDIDPNSIIGQFENLRSLTRSTKGKINALSLTGLANKAGLDFRLINPSAPDDPNSKVNHAVANMLGLWKTTAADRGVQLVFCDLSVPQSARSLMANKEKRVFVRDERGESLVHLRGSLHAPRGTPYYLVPVGRGKDRTISIYDPMTGQLMKSGVDGKQEAHDFVLRLLSQPDGLERWLDLRESSRPITPDEIDEYKNEKGLDVDGNSADIEISLIDVEGVSGSVGFSVYDDMKRKLVASGVPSAEIEFIHDHDSPQSKFELYKRVNSGEVRFLFGSTAKMGTGTCVQERVVGLHHIDAPYRPSDLEQRDGRAIRRGNKLYERDPKGFRLNMYRYATEQTYDTRRWQILEHKASGIEQLRNYKPGLNEIDDVASEAANSADMKAAASGNPLVLKETQLGNEVKRLRLLERAHQDGQFILASKLNAHSRYVTDSGPAELLTLKRLALKRDQAPNLAAFRGVQLDSKEELLSVVDRIALQVAQGTASASLQYRGMDFQLSRNERMDGYAMRFPNGETVTLESITRGVVTRMENYSAGLEKNIEAVEARMVESADQVERLRPLVGKAFPDLPQLADAIAEHGKVQRALRRSNSFSAVKEHERAEFARALSQRKSALTEMGFGQALDQITKEESAQADLTRAKPPALARPAVQALDAIER